MRQEIRNLKGEIVREASDKDPWWKLSTNTWILIAGFVLLCIGCFVDPETISKFFHLLDPRFWRWWYFIPLTLILVFAVRWVMIALRYDDYDAEELATVKIFLRMSIFISVLSGTIVALHATEHLRRFTVPVEIMFTSGKVSGMAIISYIVLLVILIPLIYFIKEWVQSW